MDYNCAIKAGTHTMCYLLDACRGAEAFLWGPCDVSRVRELSGRLQELKSWVDDVREASGRKNTREELAELVGRMGPLSIRFYELNKVIGDVALR